MAERQSCKLKVLGSIPSGGCKPHAVCEDMWCSIREPDVFKVSTSDSRERENRDIHKSRNTREPRLGPCEDILCSFKQAIFGRRTHQKHDKDIHKLRRTRAYAHTPTKTHYARTRLHIILVRVHVWCCGFNHSSEPAQEVYCATCQQRIANDVTCRTIAWMKQRTLAMFL